MGGSVQVDWGQWYVSLFNTNMNQDWIVLVEL